MRLPHDTPGMRTRRRALRARATPSEQRLWQLLRRRGVAGAKFRRQHSIGRYVVDFYCDALRLAVELDGPVHDRPEVRAYDAARTAWLERHGIRVVRLPNAAVWDDAEGVCRWLGAVAAARRRQAS